APAVPSISQSSRVLRKLKSLSDSPILLPLQRAWPAHSSIPKLCYAIPGAEPRWVVIFQRSIYSRRTSKLILYMRGLDAHQELALLCGTRFVFLLDVSRPKRRVQPSART